MIHGNRRETQADDTIEGRSKEGETALLSDLTESVGIGSETAHGDLVGGKEAVNSAGSVLDGEIASVTSVGGGTAVIVLVVEEASGRSAALRGEPSVGRASIGNDSEVLGRRSSSDGNGVHGVLVVNKGILVGLSKSVLSMNRAELGMELVSGFTLKAMNVHWHFKGSKS